jgi:hypothetical protein
MSPKKILRVSFALELKKCLLQRYQELPSAAFVAKEFNLRTHTTEAITQESARRWIRGLAIPDLAKLLVLRSWLNLDINALGAPILESLEKNGGAMSNNDFAEQEEFIKTTQSIRQSLHILMGELESLEKKLIL